MISRVKQFGLQKCNFLYFELIVVFQSFLLEIFNMFQPFKLVVKFVMPRVEYCELEDESSGADAAGDG